jgi:membrane-associated phospholipid phosphatase
VQVRISALPLWLPILYLGVHSAYLLTARYRPARVGRLLLVNIVLTAIFLYLISLLDSSLMEERWFRLTVFWIPVVFFWWAYLWAGRTLHLFYPPGVSFDDALIRLEARWFGQPSLHLALRYERPWLSDILHFSYNSYFLYTFALGVYLHASGRNRDFQAMTFAVILGYALAYSFFPLLPVKGPRWGLIDAGLLHESRQRLRGSWMTRATNRLMYEGLAHRGAAMPSAHSSTAVVFAVWVWRIWGGAGGLPALALVLTMALGAVYGRYHYLLDVLVGGTLGLLCLLVADYLI